MSEISVAAYHSIREIGRTIWERCAAPISDPKNHRVEDPFTSFAFFDALEQSGSVGPETGWQPLYMCAKRDGKTIGCAPLFIKQHSQGEYVFDHAWAEALHRTGRPYYPKLQIASPFSPVTGPRFLAAPENHEAVQNAIIAAAQDLARAHHLSSLHVTFCSQAEAAAAPDHMLHRTGQQYHWHNANYHSFDDFLGALSSRKRKAVRKERAQAQNFGGTIELRQGDDIRPHDWDAFWEFYQDTGARKWGTPYLTRKFFTEIHGSMRDDILLGLAVRDSKPIAGALNFIGSKRLFGRYWGAIEHHPCLHFELCYYQAIEWAIAHGLDAVEAGAQGDHKLARGYMPVETHSLHWMRDADFHDAVAAYLQEERAAVSDEIAALRAFGPFKSGAKATD